MNEGVTIEINGNPCRPDNFSVKDTDPFARDFGVLVRGPHPVDPNYMLMVMAGRSSLGTEAVCRAATDPLHIAEIKKFLEHDGVDLSDHKQGFYAVVTMDRDMKEDGTYEAILPSFKVAAVHGLRRG